MYKIFKILKKMEETKGSNGQIMKIFAKPQNRCELVQETKGEHIYLTPKQGKHTETLIWLHGRGDSAKGFVDIFLGWNIWVKRGSFC